MDLTKTRAFLEFYKKAAVGVPAGALATESLAELDRAEEVLKVSAQWKVDARAELRDTFAAAALTGLLASPDRDGSFDAYARDAYLCADAMLAAREGK